MARLATKDAHDTSPRNLGRYRLYGELAAGGMATVHLGRQIGSGGFSKMVAIKRLHPQFGKLDEFVEMFLAEARLAARIRHPNVVQPLDVLRVEDEVFLVMEYVEGDSLSRLMKATVVRQEKVPLPIAVAILSGILRGLHAAHEAKSDKGEPLEIIHRDVSPQNVLVGVDGGPRVIDFGIAKAADSVQVTREGELKGKLAYIAPEILSGKRGTRRADIYAAAVVLWEVLTAQRLFDADYQSAIVANILHRPVDPPSDFIENLPPAIDKVVMKGLERDPSDRYATAREMAVALEEALPAASPAVVGEWVERMASISLKNRGDRVAQIEAHSSLEDSSEQAEEVLSEFMTISSEELPAAVPSSGQRPVAGPPGPAPSRNRTQPLPITVPPPPNRTLPAVGASAPLPPPPRSPTLAGVAPPPPSRSPSIPGLPPPPSRAPSIPGLPPPPSRAPSLPGPTISVGEGEQQAPAWPVPGIAPAPAGTVLHVGPKHRSSGGGIVIFILVAALFVATVYIGLPEFLKRSYSSVAAREGVSLSIDSVEVSFRRVRLVGVGATMADLPGFTAHAKAVEIWFSYQLDPTEVAAHDVLLSIDGTASAVEDTLRRARLAHDFAAIREGTLRQVNIDTGHLVWSRALGEGTQLEAENVTLGAERNGHDALGNDLTFTSSLVTASTAWGKLGPWSASGQVDHGLTKATLTLDPSGASKAAATFVIDKGTVTTFDFTLPRSNVGLLGVAPAVASRRPEEAFFAEGEAHYAVRSASRIEASVRLSLSGARMGGALAPADAQLEAHVDGDPARPIDVTKGLLVYGPFRGAVGGTVTVGDPFVRADVGFRTGTNRCPNGSDASLAGGLAFDTRTLGDAHLLLAPSGRCALKILPP
jgi:serine/threonine-protein kinase